MAGLGLGLARGIESGLRIGQSFRNEAADRERQARLDSQAEARQVRTDQRQNDQDALQALGAQETLLAAEGAGLADADPAAKAEFAARATGVRKQRLGLLSKISSRDIEGSIIAGQMDLKQLQEGADPTSLPPGAFTRAVTVGTGRKPADYLRGPNGEPAPLEKAIFDLSAADGDHDASVPAANTIFQPELRRSVGKPSKYGGKIVDQQIIGIVPDPKSPPDDPRVFLQTRVYINNKDFRGPTPPGTPEGATGHYDSVITAGRSADPNDPPRSISMKAALDKVQTQMEAIDVLNTPQARAKLDEDAKSGAWDADEFYQRAMAQLTGGRAAKTSSKLTPIGPRGLLEQKTDSSGKVISERTIAPPDVASGGGTPQERLLKTKLQAIEDDEDMTDTQKAQAKRAALSGIKPGKYSGDGGSGGGGGGGGDAKAKLAERKEDRAEREAKRKELKDQFDRADKNADNAETAYRDFNKQYATDGPPSEKKNPKAYAAYIEERDALRTKAQKARQRASSLSDELDKPEPAEAPAAAPAAAAPAKKGIATTGKDFSKLWN